MFGLERATDLCMELGGGLHYIPRTPTSALVHFLNADEIALLREAYGGTTVAVPKAVPVCINRLYFVDGIGATEIARRLRVTKGAVHTNIRAGTHPLVAKHVQTRRG